MRLVALSLLVAVGCDRRTDPTPARVPYVPARTPVVQVRDPDADLKAVRDALGGYFTSGQLQVFIDNRGGPPWNRITISGTVHRDNLSAVQSRVSEAGVKCIINWDIAVAE